MRKLIIINLVLLLLWSCEKDPMPVIAPSLTSTTVTDVDGNVYHTITLGRQVWMIENLKTTKYNDNTPIPNISSATTWTSLTTGAYCDYNNSVANGAKYGHLYNWYAVNTGKLAPKGWHVPTNDEWITLENYIRTKLGTSGSLSKALASNTDWTTCNIALAVGNDLTSNNSSGFTALPGGAREGYTDYNGVFTSIGTIGFWWTSSTDGNGSAIERRLFNTDIYGTGDFSYTSRGGSSVRCIKD